MASKYSPSGLTPSIPANLNYETITNEFSRLSDVQEEYYFMSGQLDEEPEDFHRIRNNISRNINEAINDVKRALLKLREDISEDNLKEYKEKEQIALEYINAYVDFTNSNPWVYGEIDRKEPYKSIAYYQQEGEIEPRI